MDTSPSRTNKWSLEVNPNNLGLKLAGGRLARLQGKAGDVPYALAGFHFAGGHRCGHQRSCAMARDGRSNNLQRFCRALHYVVSAGTVNMDVYKTRDDCLPPRDHLANTSRQYHRAAPPYFGDLASLDDNYGVGNLFEWSERAVGVYGNRLHRGGIIV